MRFKFKVLTSGSLGGAMAKTTFGAVVDDDIDRLSELIKGDPFVDCPDSSGLTALHLAGETMRQQSSTI